MTVPNQPQNELKRRFGAKAAESWSQVLRHFELSDGFSFLVLFVPDATASRICEAELKRFLSARNQTLRTLEYSTPDELHDHLPTDLIGTQEPDASLGAVWVSSVISPFAPEQPAWDAAWRFAAARINERRNILIQQYTVPVVVVGSQWLKVTLREAAPDWWSVRSLVITLQPDPVPSDLQPEDRLEAIEFSRHVLEDSGDALLDPDLALEMAAKLRGVIGEERALLKLLVRASEALMNRERWGEKLEVDEEVLGLLQKIGANQTENAEASYNYGVSLMNLGLLEKAEQTFRTVLDGQISLASRGITMDMLGRVLFTSGSFKEAEKAFRTALELKEAGGDSEISCGITMDMLGRVLRDSGRLEEAERAFRTALDWEEAGGASLTRCSITLYELGRVLFMQGRLEESERAFRTALERSEADGDWLIGRSFSANELGNVLLSQGRFEEAEQTFRQAIEMGERGGDTRESIEISQFNLVLALSLQGKPITGITLENQEHRSIF